MANGMESLQSELVMFNDDDVSAFTPGPALDGDPQAAQPW